MSHWSDVPERGEARSLRLGFMLLNMLGYTLSVGLLCPIMIYFFLTGKASRKASMEYLRRLHETYPDKVPKPTLWHSFRHHFSFGLNILDRMWMWQGKLKKFRFDSNGSHHLVRNGVGALVIGSHFGSFDALRSLAQKGGVRMNVVMYRAHAQVFNKLMKEMSPESNLHIYELAESDMNAVFELKERIEMGEMVAILGDRLPPIGKQRLKSLPFLGKPAPFPQNPWIMAHLLECPVFFTCAYRIGYRKYYAFMEQLTDQVLLPRRRREEALEDYMKPYVEKLEMLCRKQPYQWFNFFNFWQEETKQMSPNQEGS